MARICSCISRSQKVAKSGLHVFEGSFRQLPKRTVHTVVRRLVLHLLSSVRARARIAKRSLIAQRTNEHACTSWFAGAYSVSCTVSDTAPYQNWSDQPEW